MTPIVCCPNSYIAIEELAVIKLQQSRQTGVLKVAGYAAGRSFAVIKRKATICLPRITSAMV
jgi:hypothetical protein